MLDCITLAGQNVKFTCGNLLGKAVKDFSACHRVLHCSGEVDLAVCCCCANRVPCNLFAGIMQLRFSHTDVLYTRPGSQGVCPDEIIVDRQMRGASYLQG